MWSQERGNGTVDDHLKSIDHAQAHACREYDDISRESFIIYLGTSQLSVLVSGTGMIKLHMMTSIRLALFLCDTPLPSVQETDGDYTTIFTTLLHNSAPNTHFIIDPYDVKNRLEYPEDVDQYQGIILTGSGQPTPYPLGF